jgi:hypothetical protein
MISGFEFEDTFENLFVLHDAYRCRDLVEFSHKTVYISLSSIAYKLLDTKEPGGLFANANTMISMFKDLNIEVRIIDNGIDNVDRVRLVNYFSKLNLMRNKFYYFKMISSFMVKISDQDQNFFELNEKLRVAGRTQSIGLYSLRVFFYKDLTMTLDKLGLKIQRAPQSLFNQIVYYIRQSPESAACGGNIGLLLSDVNSMISEIDFKSRKVREYDFELLASRMRFQPALFRKCLFGSLIYFICHPSTKDSLKYLDAYIEDPNNFDEVYTKLKLSKEQTLLDQLMFLKQNFSHDRIDDSFIDQMCKLYDFNRQEVIDHSSYYFNSMVLTNENKIVPFPCNENFKSSRYILDDVDSRLVKHFCNFEINEDILYYFSKITNHTYTVFYPKFEFIEFTYVHKVYYLTCKERNIFKFLNIFDNGKNLKITSFSNFSIMKL